MWIPIPTNYLVVVAYQVTRRAFRWDAERKRSPPRYHRATVYYPAVPSAVLQLAGFFYVLRTNTAALLLFHCS